VAGILFTVGSWVFAAIAFLFGLLFGSFLNVCIYRLPRGLSVISPRSACVRCGTAIAAYDNIPVISWFVLGGKCRSCGVGISSRYWIVELLTGCLFAMSVYRFGAGLEGLKYTVFSFLILGLIFTDADLKLLPDDFTLTGLGLGIALSLFVNVDGPGALLLGPVADQISYNAASRLVSLSNSLLGAAAGSLFIWGIGELYFRLRGVEGMGFGDVKLMAMVGAFLGIKLTILTLMLGAMSGSFVGVGAMLNVYRKRRRRWLQRGHPRRTSRQRSLDSARLMLRYYEMPFGVFLGAAALFAAFLGKPVVDWYLGHLR
jgi:leader peptidase (prepilin peptidase) / N-methyltransferase